jgi:replication factor C subunit 1
MLEANKKSTNNKIEKVKTLDDENAELEALKKELNSHNKKKEQENEYLLKQKFKQKEIDVNTLWTIRYAPQNSSQIVGNKVNVNKLKNWLTNWKNNVSDLELNEENYDSENLKETDGCKLTLFNIIYFFIQQISKHV